MKKLLAVLLAAVLLLGILTLTCAVAEAAEAHAAPLVDLTGVIIALLLAAFEFLLAWIAKVIIPPIREWLKTHTTEKQRGLLWDAICKLVDAAEQTIIGPGKGAQRLAYVEAGLMQRGFTIDDDLIEAAVRRMKTNTGLVFAEAFEAKTEPPEDPEEPESEIE